MFVRYECCMVLMLMVCYFVYGLVAHVVRMLVLLLVLGLGRG